MPRLDVIGMVSLILCLYATVPSVQDQCGRPPKIENAMLEGDWDEDTKFPPRQTVIYSCHPGYTSLGRIRRACVGGEWQTLSRAHCKKKSCGHPGEIPFGTLELKNGYEFVFGVEVEYTCDDGYQIVSKHNTRICAADGWTNYPPHCEARLCPPVFDDSVRVLSSVMDDEYSMGHVINFECKNPKQTLQGPSQIYCTANGTWNVDPPTCKESCTIQEIDMKKNNIHLRNNSVLHVNDNANVNFECSYGYNTLDPATLTIQCNNGVLDYPTCQKIAMKPCGRPPQVMYGKIIGPMNNTYESGSMVTYKCQQFFTTFGPEIIQCQDGIWGNPPACIDELHGQVYSRQVLKPCGRPPQIQHGAITTTMKHLYNSGSSVTYTCLRFYRIHGQKLIACHDGKWDEPPVCLGNKQCDRPPHIQHGEIAANMKTTYNSGSSVKYRCQKFYTIDGEKAIRCQDGIWGQPPVCLEPCTTSETRMHENHITLMWKDMYKKHCIRSNQNKEYAKKCYVTHNDIITFACLPGYMKNGTMNLISKCYRGILSYPRCLDKY
ncbi:coagulation factor XIII B chain-like isoform 2-T2 [Anomaloglossus baeobatrachus]|uniref:coagulation factor XIII B chain-like isoform X2 n=1 Tax=Anomaloglossus baeobatrachus TaxID=238106 RepID=UPI003F4F7521